MKVEEIMGECNGEKETSGGEERECVRERGREGR